MNNNEEVTPEVYMELIKRNIEAAAKARAEATRNRMKAKAQQGYCMSKPPLGYQRTDIKGLYSPSGLGEVMGVLFASFADGVINAGTVIELLIRFAHIYSGSKPSFEKVYNLLSNPYYAGYVSFNGKLFQGLHMAIITREQHSKIVNKLSAAPLMRKSR